MKKKNSVIVVGGGYYGEPFRWLSKPTTKLKRLIAQPDKIDLVVFTGGEDVHPGLYKGIDQLNLCATNLKRDMMEKSIFEFCLKHNIKMTGICRGFQFINVMAGGFMYQHITDHGLTGHHDVYFPYNDKFMQVTSTHHQLVGLRSGSFPIAWADPKRSQFYVGPYGEQVEDPELEVEAAVFPAINAMGVQYHPEVMHVLQEGRRHYEEMVRDFVYMEMNDFVEKYAWRNYHVREPRATRTEAGRKVGRAATGAGEEGTESDGLEVSSAGRVQE